MKSAEQIVVNIELDTETISEIEMLRKIRLAHYESMAINPDKALKTLIKAGLKEDISLSEIEAKAREKIKELNDRLSDRDTIYEDELALYLSTLDL
jgi:hypothetical protein